jgi:hypothetical protein
MKPPVMTAIVPTITSGNAAPMAVQRRDARGWEAASAIGLGAQGLVLRIMSPIDLAVG